MVIFMNATIKTDINKGNASVGTGPSSQFGIAGRRGAQTIGQRAADPRRSEPMSVSIVRDAARSVVKEMEKGTMDAAKFDAAVKEIVELASGSPKTVREEIIGIMVDEMRRPIARMANGSKDAGQFYSVINKAICDLKGFNPDAEYTRA